MGEHMNDRHLKPSLRWIAHTLLLEIAYFFQDRGWITLGHHAFMLALRIYNAPSKL